MLDPQMEIVADTFFWKIDDEGPQLFKGANNDNIVQNKSKDPRQIKAYIGLIKYQVLTDLAIHGDNKTIARLKHQGALIQGRIEDSYFLDFCPPSGTTTYNMSKKKEHHN